MEKNAALADLGGDVIDAEPGAWTEGQVQWIIRAECHRGADRSPYTGKCRAIFGVGPPGSPAPGLLNTSRQGRSDLTTPQGALTSSGLAVLDQDDGRGGRIVGTVLIRKRLQFDSN